MVAGIIDTQGHVYIYIYIYIYPQGISETSGSSDILLYLFEVIFVINLTIT